eukprot:TRINITY_DN4412_c0_g1_i12.p1 TRINITY_DN4412_c0_g1~~TRINITY_DN4412_c0_g1_i12.p1  ORF type:complete len:220 (-),score=44.18 TRINITY_DN4412_c0_g1_i12:702-1289(-)
MEHPVTKDAVIETLKKINPVVNNKFDALFVLIHAIMQCNGFKLVGLGEEGNTVEEKNLPVEWNQSQDSWSFRYKHYRSSMTFLLKAIRIGNNLLVHGLALEQNEILNLDLEVSKYVDTSDNFSVSNFSSLFKSLPELIENVGERFVKKFVPSVQDLERQRNQSSTQSNRNPSSGINAEYGERDHSHQGFSSNGAH